MKKVLGGLIIGIIIGIAAFGAFKKMNAKETIVEVNSVTLQEKIQEVSELSTASYIYTNADKAEGDPRKIFGKNVPFTDKSFVVQYDGKIKAGFSMKEAEVKVKGTNVIIKLPKTEILSNEITDFAVLDKSKNIFNRVEPEDVTDFQANQKKVMEEKAIANGVFDEAEKNADTYFKGLLYEILPDGYTVTVEHQK